MGLRVGEVGLEEWKPEWKTAFDAEKQRLQNVFGELTTDIQHIGSTSVEGLSVKPIIDIAVGLTALADFELVRSRFHQLSDYSIKENNIPGEILIRKGPAEDCSAFIHVLERNGTKMQQMLRFRDTLRNHPEICYAYETLKRTLAEKFPHDRERHTAAKANFIQRFS